MERECQDSLVIIEPGSDLDLNLKRTYAINSVELRKYFSQTADQIDKAEFHDFPLCHDHEYRYGLNFSGPGTHGNHVFLTDFDSIQSRQKQFMELWLGYSHIFFLGTGIGEYLLMLADFFQRGSVLKDKLQLPVIWIIEPQPIWLKATLSFVDLHDLWGLPILRCVVGEAWKEDLFNQLPLNFKQGGKYLIVQNPTRELSQFVESLLSVADSVGHEGINIWDGNRQSLIVKDEKCIETPCKPLHFMPFDIKDKHIKIYQKNVACLRKHRHFYGGGKVFSELKNSVPNIVCDKEDNFGIILGREGEQDLAVRLNDSLSKQTLVQFEFENSHNITYLIAGSGDGTSLKRIFDISNIVNRWDGFGQIIYLIEPDPAIFKVCLYLFDFSNEFKSDRVRIFVGKDSFEVFSKYLKNDLQARRPNKFYTSSYCEETNFKDQLQELLLEREQSENSESKRIFDSISTYYSSITPIQWSIRFNNPRKLKILAVTTRLSSFAQYCTRDLIEGFKKINCECKIVIEKDALSSLSILTILSAFKSFKPDLVFLINHLRDESKYIPSNVPYFCWVQDPLYRLFDDNTLSINNYEHVCTISNKWKDELNSKNKYCNTHVEFLPLGVNDDVHKPFNIKQKKYDISYISHMSDPKDLFSKYGYYDDEKYLNIHEKQIIERDPSMAEIIGKLYIGLSDRIYALNLDKLGELVSEINRKIFLQDTFVKLNLCENRDLILYLLSTGSRLWKTIEATIKYRVIHLLVDVGLSVGVWGLNWDKYPGMSKFAKGPAQNGKIINDIQNETRISINNAYLISFHMRAMEIMASNNFMLTRRNQYDLEPISDHFIEGEEIILFDNEDDLVEKVDYYLCHPDEMKKVSQRAYEKVRDNHTYKAIAGKILNDFRYRFEPMIYC